MVIEFIEVCHRFPKGSYLPKNSKKLYKKELIYR